MGATMNTAMNTSIACTTGSDIAQSIIDNMSGPDIVDALKDEYTDDIATIILECVENYKAYSPFELTAKEINESDNAEELWAAFNDGIADKITLEIEALKKQALEHVNHLIEQERDDMFDNEYDTYDELLDSANDEIVIGGMTFLPSQVLKECDPIAYREGYLCFLNDHMNEEIEELEDVKEKIVNS